MRFMYPFLVFTLAGVLIGLFAASDRAKGTLLGLMIGAAVGVYAGLGGVF